MTQGRPNVLSRYVALRFESRQRSERLRGGSCVSVGLLPETCPLHVSQ